MTSTIRVEGFSGAKNLPFTRQLLRRRQEANGLELLAIARCVNEGGLSPIFGTLVQGLRAVPPELFWRIWTTPASYLWTKLAFDVVRPIHRRSPLLARHAAWLGTSVEQLSTDHLAQIALFTIAGNLAGGTSYSAPCPVPVARLGSFPGVGLSWLSDRPFLLVGGTADGDILVSIDGEEHIWREADSAGNGSCLFRTPLACGKGNIWIDCWDSCMRMNYEGMEWSPRVTDYPSLQVAAQRVSRALARIEAYSETLADEIGEVLTQAAPLKPLSEHISPSGSVSFMPGAFYFCDVQDENRLAEMIIHELSHSKLNLLNDLDPLLDPARHGDGWDNPSSYSPWRNDPRPLKGILHGLFVFVEVAAFWANRVSEGEADSLAIRRFKTVVSQTEIALDVLTRQARFTATGERLIGDLRDRLDGMRGLSNEIDGDRIAPLYAELQNDNRFTSMSVSEAIRLHRETYDIGRASQVS